MRNKDIEKKLINSADSFVPDCLEQVLEKTRFVTPVDNNIAWKPAMSFFKRCAIAFSIVLVLIVSGAASFFGYMNQDYQTIYMDINPSMAVTINHFEKVKEIVYINDDAEGLFSDYQPIGKSIDEVMQKFIDECSNKGVFEQNSTLYISLYGKNQSKAQEALDKLNDKVNEILNEKQIKSKVEKNRITKEEKSNAEAEKISPAKLRLINMIISQTQKYLEEDLRDMTMQELRAIIDELIDEEIFNKGGSGQNPDANDPSEPDGSQDEQNPFPDNSEKIGIINMIIELTQRYTQDELLEMDLDDLKEILHEIIYELKKEQFGKGSSDNGQWQKNG